MAAPAGPLTRLTARGGAAEAGKRDRDQQGHAVEHRLDPERATELLDAGDADRQDDHADDRAPDIDPSGLDRGRAEKRADQGGQQEIEADAGLADAQPRREQQPAMAAIAPRP